MRRGDNGPGPVRPPIGIGKLLAHFKGCALRFAAADARRGDANHAFGYGHDHLAPGQIDVERRSQRADLALAGLHDERTRSEEHTSELQSLMRILYAVSCLTTKKYNMANATH